MFCVLMYPIFVTNLEKDQKLLSLQTNSKIILQRLDEGDLWFYWEHSAVGEEFLWVDELTHKRHHICRGG